MVRVDVSIKKSPQTAQYNQYVDSFILSTTGVLQQGWTAGDNPASKNGHGHGADIDVASFAISESANDTEDQDLRGEDDHQRHERAAKGGTE